MKPPLRLWPTAICPMPPSVTISARCIWTIRSCRLPQSLPKSRRRRTPRLSPTRTTTRTLLHTAQGLGDTDAASAAAIRRDITGILHTLNEAYETLYNTLLQDVSMDVSTEIDTLEAMLRQDGLTHNFESDFNTRS